jgi:hypothetical protein
LAKNTDLVTEKMNMATKAFKENTALQKEFDIQSKSLSNKWQLFKNVIGETALIIGLKLMPTIKSVLDTVISLVSSINELTNNFKWRDLVNVATMGIFGGSKESDIFNRSSTPINANVSSEVRAILDGQINVSTSPNLVATGTQSKLSGMGGNIGLNMAGAM